MRTVPPTPLHPTHRLSGVLAGALLTKETDVLRERFYHAYTSLRNRKGRVAIHRLRDLLNWPADRFDAMVEHLRAESEVVLHRGDPSRLSDAKRRRSYAVNGQLYVTLSWSD